MFCSIFPAYFHLELINTWYMYLLLVNDLGSHIYLERLVLFNFWNDLIISLFFSSGTVGFFFLWAWMTIANFWEFLGWHCFQQSYWFDHPSSLKRESLMFYFRQNTHLIMTNSVKSFFCVLNREKEWVQLKDSFIQE